MSSHRSVRRALWAGPVAALMLGSSMLAGGAAAASDPAATAAAAGGPSAGGPTVGQAVQHDVSAPLRDLAPGTPAPEDRGIPRDRLEDLPTHPGRPTTAVTDPVVQGTLGTATPPTSTSFDGVPNISGYYPPDTNGDIGPKNYVQWVNVSFQIFDRTGKSLYGPALGNTLWNGFGGPCASQNAGDPIVKYDRQADRWVMAQFTSSSPYGECVAVSTTGDPTGSYYRYFFQFSTTTFYDYPKIGIWPDGYYLTANRFSGNSFLGAAAVVLDRSSMLTGTAASYQQFTTSYPSLLPADVDGPTQPAAGAPEPIADINGSSLNVWRFHVDWTTPSNSTFTTAAGLAVAAYNQLCPTTRSCIPQPGTSVGLDGLGDRLMYRLAYRRFADHEALVVSHSVNAASTGLQAGVRWYEIRNATSGTPTIYQQGTFAPDATNRWLGSMAMDANGDIALGYSAASSSVYAGIRITGRTPSDTAGTMSMGETTVIKGSGSQTGTASRWGDYASMSIDPVDDCTFWFTTEYMPTTGGAPWQTRIAWFKFPGCGSTAQTLTSVAVSPASASVAVGGTQQFTATALDQSGAPMATQPTFSWSVSGGGSINTSTGLFTAATAGGPFTVTATTGTVSGTASVTVTAPSTLTSITVSPSSATVATGAQQQFTATGYDQYGAALSPQPSFSWTVNGGGTIDPSTGLFTAGASAGGPYTVTATSGSVSGTASVSVVAPSFSISASPSARSIKHGQSTSYSVTITRTSGFAGAVGFTVSALPAGVTGTFSPSSTTGTSSTLSISTSGSSPRGSYSLTITGTSGSIVKTANVTLTIK